MGWKIKTLKRNLKLNRPILVEGLPGIGNVGKLAVDFLVDELNAKDFIELSSYDMPNMAFVNEEGLVEMPKIKLYYKKTKGNLPDLLFLSGDIQPTENRLSHEFSDSIITLSKKLNVREIITLGGIGLSQEIKRPKVYCTSHSQKLLDNYKKRNLKIKTNVYGVVGPIFGASGLLVGMAKEKKIPAAALLAETFNNPFNLGIKGAKELIKILNVRLNLKLDIKKLNLEVKKIEKQIKENLKETSKYEIEKNKDTTYIG